MCSMTPLGCAMRSQRRPPHTARVARAHRAALQNWFPFNWVLPTGDVFTLSHRTSRVLAAQSGAACWARC